ncbi:MAG: DUF2917 domain-containing protein [Acidovorax sp.]|uniref:DUF2917 domain-containing protein n=1 Tax=Acidovorax sp. TaxID=1872122 RepID=UPI0025C28D1E|nr:DUF2917 domain-containing protein [Acidovorax sp.]MCE1194723.1 DUF2917 domain-containing protein [Acidovorax sp.]
MFARHVLESQQSPHAAAPLPRGAGCWKLAAGRALSLHPRERSVVEVVDGRVWLTLRGAPGAGQPGRAADVVLQAGDRLTLVAGQHAVLEAWSPAGASGGAAFDWLLEPEPEAAPAAGWHSSTAHRAQWEGSVVQPLRDLGRALGQGGRAVGWAGAQALGATGRLAAGLARFALFWIATPRQRRPV